MGGGASFHSRPFHKPKATYRAPLQVITFEALMERSLLQMAWTTCVERLKDKPPLGKARVDAVKEVGQAPKSFKWMALPERERRTVRARMLRRRMYIPPGARTPHPPRWSASLLSLAVGTPARTSHPCQDIAPLPGHRTPAWTGSRPHC